MSKELISYLRLLHGAYNTVVISLFVYQGILGLRIRKSEKKPFHIIRRHRKIGPVIAILGPAGFIAGMTVAFLEWGRLLKYPYHFITGLTLVSLIITTFIISRKIKGPDPYWRNRHYALGILIICLYSVQAFLGLGILL
ncbi:MAG: DUF4079 domain-containing protein [Nitrospirae bacterium]|nr:DUF4079 domain-containing protein [Nitrospirota bacterium]